MNFSIKDLLGDGTIRHDVDPHHHGFVGKSNRQLLLERIQRLRRERMEASMPEFAELRQAEQQVKRGEELD